jgi:hypothetical protein
MVTPDIGRFDTGNPGILLSPGEEVAKPHPSALALEVVDPFKGEMTATPVVEPPVEEASMDTSDILGVVPETKTLELGC